MPRFLVIQRASIEHDLDKRASDLFKQKPTAAAAATVASATGAAKDAKSTDGSGTNNADGRSMTVTWNLGGNRGCERREIADPAEFYTAVYGGDQEVTRLDAYQVEAKNELDLYYQMVMNDKHFSLETFAAFYKTWQPSMITGGVDVGQIFHKPELVLVSTVLGPIDPAIKKQLVQSGEYAPAVWSDRSWITPQLAKQMWLIYNDPRALLVEPGVWDSAAGFNCTTPDKYMTYARILALDSIPLKSLSSKS